MIFVFQFAIPTLQAQDTIEFSPARRVARRTRTVPVSAASPQEHSATRALLLSLVPGGGQIYNHQAWKLPIIYGAFAGVGYFIHYNYTRMDMFKTEYLYRVNNNDAPQLQGYESYRTSNIYSLYNSYNRNFQLMVIIAAAIYGLNLIDAYVFGHLFDFQIDDNISMSFTPALQPLPSGLHPTVGVTFSF